VVLIKTGVDAVVREGGPMLTVIQDADEANGNEAGQRSLLDEIDRDGASRCWPRRGRPRSRRRWSRSPTSATTTAAAWCYATDITGPARC
jgi:hypothetical protein